ncbi:MAG: class I SAM-dependent methyltransferase [Polyangiaceae bacterium]
MRHDTVQRGLKSLYANRFPVDLHEQRRQIWKRLYEDWLRKFIAPGDSVLEIAPGYCEFINSLEAEHERVGVDLNVDSQKYAAPGVKIHIVAAENMATVLPKDHFDVVFASNFFEHCHSRDALVSVLAAVHDVLKPGGRVLVLGPNLKYCMRSYFDYFDHHLPLTDGSMAEALRMSGFTITEQLPQTLPFTIHSRLPTWPPLISLYLRVPLAWKVFGAQFFIVAAKSGPRPHP